MVRNLVSVQKLENKFKDINITLISVFLMFKLLCWSTRN